MGYTNTTTHYSLPQYVATDKPKYLTDFNETMTAIDTQMYTNAQAAATADGKAVAAKDVADGAVSSIGTLNTQINGDVSDPSDRGLAGDVSDNSGAINTINSLIGNGTPTTTDQTIIGAINELHAEIGGGSSPSIPAADVTYDNTTSGLLAENAQAAIDEVVAALPTAGAVELQTGTLVAGNTSVTLTFTEQTVGATSLIDVYVEDGINYTAIATTSTTVVLTFESQGANKAVAVRVTN